MSSPSIQHYQEAKRVLRYVKGTSSFGVLFTSKETPRLVGYSDSDWGGSPEDKKSTTGYVFSLSGGTINGGSRVHSSVCSDKPSYMVQRRYSHLM